MKLRTLHCLVLLVVFAAGVRADEIHLSSGKVWQGRILQETNDTYLLRARSGETTIKKSAVTKVVMGPSIFDELDRRSSALAADDVTAMYALLRWCRSEKLVVDAKRLEAEILEKDPDFTPLRAERGEIKVAGEWLPEAVAMRRLGYVLREKRWLTAEEATAFDRRAAEEKRLRAVERRLNLLIKDMFYASEKRAEVAAKEFRALAERERIKDAEGLTTDLMARANVYRQSVLVELRAQHSSIGGIRNFQSSLGVGGPVTIQLPSASTTSVNTTVSVPGR